MPQNLDYVSTSEIALWLEDRAVKPKSRRGSPPPPDCKRRQRTGSRDFLRPRRRSAWYQTIGQAGAASARSICETTTETPSSASASFSASVTWRVCALDVGLVLK